MSLFALDVGGTSMKGAVLSLDLTPVSQLRLPTPHGADAAVAAVLNAVDRLLETSTFTTPSGSEDAIGLVLPGIVDDTRGVAVWAENIGWRDVPFRRLIEERTGLPVAVGHDVRAGGVAELRLGAATGFANSLIMPIGTGISGAVVIDGHLCVGGGYAGEIGHMSVGADDVCVCGGIGCLETVASAAAVARRFSARTGRAVTGSDEVVALVRAGDPDATAIWEQTVGYLGTALAAATAFLAPEVIVIGGGLSEAGDLLLTPLAKELDGRLTFHRRPVLTRAHFGADAGCIGAALLARDLLERP